MRTFELKKLRLSNVKKTWGLLVCLCICLTASSQTQQGYVKTKGRLGNNGSVIAGSRIQGATIQIKGRTAVLSQADGTFSFPIPAQKFYLQNVQKQGFVLTDPDILSRQHNYSAAPLVLVMEDKAQQEAERRAIEHKISRKLYAELQKRQDEIDALLEQNKISEEKYRELQQQLNKDQDDNASIIKEMAERYMKIDFDEVDDFNRQISDCIINGRLTEADSLLRTKGDISERFNKLSQHHEANVQARAELEKSEEMEKKNRENLAQDCYSWFEIYKLKHQNDSAAYFLELRTGIDSTNVAWLLDAGAFIGDYLSNHDMALQHYKKAEIVANDSSDLRKIYNNMGALYFDTGNYREAVNYYEKAVSYYSEEEADIYTPRIYANLSSAYRKCQDMDGALKYALKALALSQKLLGENHVTTAGCYNTLGLLYNKLNNYDKSLEHYRKAIAIVEQLPGDNNWNRSNYYINIAGTYADMSNFPIAIDFYKKALELRRKDLGENHPLLGNVYNNLGYVERESGNYSEALNYYKTAVEYWSKSEDYRFRLIDGYGNMAVCYENLEEFENALKMYEKGETIVEELYQRGDADAMLFLPFIHKTLAKLAGRSEEYRQQYIHFMDDKAVVGHIIKGMNSPTEQLGLSEWYYILEYCNWNINSSTSYFEKLEEMKNSHQTMVIMQNKKLYSINHDGRIEDDFHIYYVTPEEKQQIKTAYDNWKKKQ